MAQLKTFVFRHVNQDTREVLDFSGQTTVSKEGLFRITVTDAELANIIKANSDEGKVSVVMGEKYYGVCGYDLTQVQRAVINGVKLLSAAAETSEYVIRYIVGSRWAAWVDESTDEFWGIGGSAGSGSSASWSGQGDIVGSADMFSFALGAQVCKKTTYTRGNHSRSEYRRVNKEEDSAHIGPHGFELATYLCWPERNCEEIPYTEDGALFFLEQLKTIVQVGILTKPLLQDVQSVQAAIRQEAAERKINAERLKFEVKNYYGDSK